MASAILLQAQQERYQNLQPFTGDLSEDVDEYIEQIKSIGSLTKESDEVLHILLKVKLSGKADCWYDNNKDSLGTWSQLRIGLCERFQQTSFSSPHIHDRHQLVFTKQLLGIKQEQNILPVPVSTSVNISSTSTTSATKPDPENNPLALFNDNQVECFEDLEHNCIHEQGRYSPILVNINDPDLNIHQRCTDETDDWNKFKKQQDDPVIKSDSVKTDFEDIFEPFVDSIGSLTADDSLINSVAPQYIQYLSSDKHEPGKPRVFKKTRTGYDWNHYNEKHYDTDNPPPKNVQGYEFNIFYPDLDVQIKPPSYSLTVCEDNRDFSILKFPAGPSYDDITFKIVHKEWNYSYHYGFRYHFPTGIVQLRFYFHCDMCGIWCIFGSTVDTHQQIPGCFNIAHRGPDCFRFENVNHFSRCIFGFHRLAIVDDIYGMQPMRLHALPHIWMIYNGEIYNFRQTQKKFGYQFETSCDGEILIHLYNDKGARFMCEQLYGVFAFILFDTKERKVFIGRDTFGVRPSFRIYTDCGFLAVSSEAKGLKGVTVASNQSLKVEALEPGTYEEYKLDENEKVEFIKKERFHSVGTFPKYDVNVDLTDDISLNIRSYLTNAVRMRLMSHRRIGCMLSGGLDSSLIAALTVQEARKQGITYPIQTFSIGMDEQSPDLLAARKVAKHLGTEHHEIRFSAEDAISHLKNIIKSLESYDITTIRASIGMYFVSKYIQEKTDTVVILSGEGADEVCQGYIYFYRQPTPEEGDRESRRLCNDLYYFDVLRADRTTAAFGLELRVPFLDHAFTSYYLSLPATERAPTKERAEKYLLRKAFDGLDFIPSEILWRPKEAFSDGVATKNKSLFEYMQEYAETQVSDSDLQRASTLYPFNTPKTKEAFLYRSIFDQLYPNQAHLTPYMWLPKWCGDQTDPSARVLKHYKEQQGDGEKSR